ncbi:MAG: hypothetical protein B5M53_01420 [Candidatus Cloacimonas sp. 4484_209]|nr:MAG: hypothetical protein B5M53_01420 [Candidatus Cloacimonas sp. 4484_209]
MVENQLRYKIFSRVPILAYHKIDRNFEWGVTRVTPSQFAMQMDFLYRNNYKIVTLSELLNQEAKGKIVSITFDDAYKDFLHYGFPVMKKYGFTATVFVITKFVGKENLWDINIGYRKFSHMDWQDLQKLIENGFEIGSHTHSHPDLRKLDKKKLTEELLLSREILEDRLKIKVKFLSYPFGRYSERIKKMVQDCGYLGAVCLSHPFRKKGNIYEIDRESIYTFDTIFDFGAKLMRHGKTFLYFEKVKTRAVNFFAGATYPLKQVEHFFSKNLKNNAKRK